MYSNVHVASRLLYVPVRIQRLLAISTSLGSIYVPVLAELTTFTLRTTPDMPLMLWCLSHWHSSPRLAGLKDFQGLFGDAQGFAIPKLHESIQSPRPIIIAHLTTVRRAQGSTTGRRRHLVPQHQLRVLALHR